MEMACLFPFIYFLVKSWNITDDEKLIGQYVGLIGAAFCLAQFLTSAMWGALSDRIGRKPVLLFGLVGSTITAVAFGFSKSFWFALSMRAASGLMNGNVGVGKTIMGEITDESNRAQAFNLFGLMWEIGSIIAPILGGILADPAHQYPWLFGNFQLFIDYPYALPCIVGAMASAIGTVAGFFFLEETLGRKAAKVEDEEEGSGLKLKNMDNEPPFLFGMPKLCAYAIVAYGINCFANIIFEEILPLFIASPKTEGGMEFTSGQMGVMMSILGVSALVVQLIFVPSWEKKYGLPNLNIWFLGIAAVTSIITPFMSYIEGPVWLIWTCLIVTLGFNIIGWGIAFTAQIVLINDTAPPSRLGAAHGISQTLAAFTRTVGPALGGWLYTRGLTDGLPYPLDRTMPYNLCAIVAVVGIVQGFYLKKEIALFEVEEDEETKPLLDE
ncbi:major facilitator superfamily domain-containing protein [Hyaloraphidium curvatum]|nr:major facilitator superfamily domain-containing protein [Hyaloraphidium curvatum]